MKKVFKYSLILITAFVIGCTCTQLVLNSFAQQDSTGPTLGEAVSVTSEIGKFPQPTELTRLGGNRYQFQNDLGRLETKVSLTHSAWAEFGTRTQEVYIFYAAYLTEGERVFFIRLKDRPWWQRIFFSSSNVPRDKKDFFNELNWGFEP